VIAIENVRLFDEIQDKNRQLLLASEYKSQFVSSVSHELRTPLNAIIGLTEMMVTNAARFGTEKAAEPLNRVHRAGTHLLGLINQVLDLSKIEAGKLELNPQTVELAPLVDEVIGTARQLAEQNKNRLVIETQEKPLSNRVESCHSSQAVRPEHQILADYILDPCQVGGTPPRCNPTEGPGSFPFEVCAVAAPASIAKTTADAAITNSLSIPSLRRAHAPGSKA
jgi:signal transduction histidine kinase